MLQVQIYDVDPWLPMAKAQNNLTLHAQLEASTTSLIACVARTSSGQGSFPRSSKVDLHCSASQAAIKREFHPLQERYAPCCGLNSIFGVKHFCELLTPTSFSQALKLA